MSTEDKLEDPVLEPTESPEAVMEQPVVASSSDAPSSEKVEQEQQQEPQKPKRKSPPREQCPICLKWFSQHVLRYRTHACVPKENVVKKEEAQEPKPEPEKIEKQISKTATPARKRKPKEKVKTTSESEPSTEDSTGGTPTDKSPKKENVNPNSRSFTYQDLEQFVQNDKQRRRIEKLEMWAKQLFS